MTLNFQEHQPNSRENEVSEEMDEVSPRPRRIVHPINRLTYDRLGGVLKELSEAGIVSEYGAYKATNFKDMNRPLPRDQRTTLYYLTSNNYPPYL